MSIITCTCCHVPIIKSVLAISALTKFFEIQISKQFGNPNQFETVYSVINISTKHHLLGLKPSKNIKTKTTFSSKKLWFF